MNESKQCAREKCSEGVPPAGDDESRTGYPCEQKQIVDSPSDGAPTKQMHGSELKEIAARQIDIDDVPVWRQAFADEEYDVVHKGCVADEWPPPTPKNC